MARLEREVAPGNLRRRRDAHRLRVVSRAERAADRAAEIRDDHDASPVPRLDVGVGAEVALELDFEAALLPGFAHGRLLRGLVDLHEAAGEAPEAPAGI